MAKRSSSRSSSTSSSSMGALIAFIVLFGITSVVALIVASLAYVSADKSQPAIPSSFTTPGDYFLVCRSTSSTTPASHTGWVAKLTVEGEEITGHAYAQLHYATITGGVTKDEGFHWTEHWSSLDTDKNENAWQNSYTYSFESNSAKDPTGTYASSGGGFTGTVACHVMNYTASKA